MTFLTQKSIISSEYYSYKSVVSARQTSTYIAANLVVTASKKSLPFPEVAALESPIPVSAEI